MGAFLSAAKTDKESEDVRNSRFVCGFSSMQGWRESQEDAHNCILDFDENASLFAVYDGHGGCEVAKYTAERLPSLLKEMKEYEEGDYTNALINAFLSLDDSIKTPEVKARLVEILGNKNPKNEASGPADAEEEERSEHIRNLVVQQLRREVPPLQKVISKYENAARSKKQLRSLKHKITKEEAVDLCTSSETVCSSSTEPDQSYVNGNAIPESTCTENDGECSSTSDVKIQNSNDAGGASKENLVEETKEKDGEELTNGVSSGGEASCSPKKKKLALEDLEDSEVVKNFIWKEAIDEFDEDDSEDETFELEDSSEDEDGDASEDDEDDDDDNEVADEDEVDSEESEDEEETTADEEDSATEDDDPSAEDLDDTETDEKEDCLGQSILLSRRYDDPGVDSGCTAVVALIKGDQLYVANAGDSRCVLSRDGVAVEMSEDHKPRDPPELERIEKAGGYVSGDCRVNGGLNLSRAIGDHSYKRNKDLPNTLQMITALPDVRVYTLDPKVEFIVLACDGIWNSMSSQEVIDFIRPRLVEKQKLSAICEELFDKCLAPNTLGDGTGCDNMTCIIITIADREIGPLPEADIADTTCGGDVISTNGDHDVACGGDVVESMEEPQLEGARVPEPAEEVLPNDEPEAAAIPLVNDEEKAAEDAATKRSLENEDEVEPSAKRQKVDA